MKKTNKKKTTKNEKKEIKSERAVEDPFSAKIKHIFHSNKKQNNLEKQPKPEEKKKKSKRKKSDF